MDFEPWGVSSKGKLADFRVKLGNNWSQANSFTNVSYQVPGYTKKKCKNPTGGLMALEPIKVGRLEWNLKLPYLGFW